MIGQNLHFQRFSDNMVTLLLFKLMMLTIKEYYTEPMEQRLERSALRTLLPAIIGRVIRSVEPHASARQLYDFELDFEYVS
mgnify:CR=1 FL=1